MLCILLDMQIITHFKCQESNMVYIHLPCVIKYQTECHMRGKVTMVRINWPWKSDMAKRLPWKRSWFMQKHPPDVSHFYSGGCAVMGMQVKGMWAKTKACFWFIHRKHICVSIGATNTRSHIFRDYSSDTPFYLLR